MGIRRSCPPWRTYNTWSLVGRDSGAKFRCKLRFNSPILSQSIILNRDYYTSTCLYLTLLCRSRSYSQKRCGIDTLCLQYGSATGTKTNPRQADNCGPFLLWACDGDPELHDNEDDDANADEPPTKKYKFDEVEADELPTKKAKSAK